MAKQMITTNIRMDRNDWIAAKAIAGEKNISLNAYINELLKVSVTKSMFPKKKNTAVARKIKNASLDSIRDLPKLIELFPKKPEKSRDENKIIYGIE